MRPPAPAAVADHDAPLLELGQHDGGSPRLAGGVAGVEPSGSHWTRLAVRLDEALGHEPQGADDGSGRPVKVPGDEREMLRDVDRLNRAGSIDVGVLPR